MTLIRGCSRLIKLHPSSRMKGTLAKQNDLGSLPLPELPDTMSKWLITAKPHLSSTEFQITQEKAKKFMTEAQPMQKYLTDKSKKTKNWVEVLFYFMQNVFCFSFCYIERVFKKFAQNHNFSNPHIL